MKKLLFVLLLVVAMFGCSTNEEEKPEVEKKPDENVIVMAPFIENAQYPCEEDIYLFLQGDTFMLAPEYSDNGYFGTYEPVGEHTYLATVTYGGESQSDEDEVRLYFTIKDGYVYFESADETTVEEMESLEGLTHTCVVE